MAELRKANFHSVDIWRLMKNQIMQKKIKKTDSNFSFFKLPSCTLVFKKKECSAYYIILSTLKNIT